MDRYDTNSTGEVLYTVLERCVEDVLSLIKPSESDRHLRLNAIDEIVKSVQSIGTLNGAAVKPFGSFVSNLYSKWGDLDISITLDQQLNSCASRNRKQNVLREIMKTLRKRGIARKIQFIPQARVPLLVYESSMYGISCDVSVDNHQGRAKSKILQLITSFDERFADMVLLIKEWAKVHRINDPKTGTLNSYSLCLLVIFHLQTCKPAILPPLKEIYDGNISDDVEGVSIEREREIDDICALNVQKIMSDISSHKNQSSLANLLVSFFDKFSEIEALSSEYVICTFTGRWERMASNTRWTEKSYCLYIEDPFEQPDNAARAVGSQNLRTIAGVVHMTRQYLSSSSVLSDRNFLLHLLSRPLVASRLKDRTSQDYVVNLNESHGIRSAIDEPKHDGLTRNRRNNHKKFAGRPPQRSDQHHNSGSCGVDKTGRANGEPGIGPCFIGSLPLVGYTITQTGSIDQAFDAGINGSRIHGLGLAIAEPVTKQINHSSKSNGSSYGYRYNKGKEVWQPKLASNQVIQ